jgi:hypothetical protein
MVAAAAFRSPVIASAFSLLGFDQQSEAAGGGNQFAQQPELFGTQFAQQVAQAGRIAARPGDARDQTKLDGVFADAEDDRDHRGRSLCGERRRGAEGSDHGHIAPQQFTDHRRQPIVLTLRPAIFDCHVPTLDISGFAQTLAERGDEVGDRVGRCAAEESDYRHRRLLRVRRERPYPDRTAKQRDECAPYHSITSSARNRIDVGTSRPIALAVLRLTVSSNLYQAAE